MGSRPAARNHAEPAVTAWKDAPELCGNSRPHGARARTSATSAPRTRPRSRMSASGSVSEPYRSARAEVDDETNGQECDPHGHSDSFPCDVWLAPIPRKEPSMDLSTSIPAVTGGARGLGRHLVDALLDRGAPTVYALARDPSRVRRDPRIVPVAFDLLDKASIHAAADHASDITLLINNASTAAFAGPLEATADSVHQEMAVNYDGTFETIRAFVGVLERNGGGQIVNVLSLLSLASTPPMSGYSASKAAAHSLTQALRPVLAAKGITVHGVYPGGIDTDMLAGIDAPKTPPSEVAAAILDGVAAEEEDIFPDPNARAMAELWWGDPKAFERAFAGAAAA